MTKRLVTHVLLVASALVLAVPALPLAHAQIVADQCGSSVSCYCIEDVLACLWMVIKQCGDHPVLDYIANPSDAVWDCTHQLP
jgi:hypothetical protein